MNRASKSLNQTAIIPAARASARLLFLLILSVCSIISASAQSSGTTQVNSIQVPSATPQEEEQCGSGASCPPIGPCTGGGGAGKECKFVQAQRDNMEPANIPDETGADPKNALVSLPKSSVRCQEKQKPAQIPNNSTPNQCSGYMKPDGQYCWQNCPKMGQTQCGQVPNPMLTMPGDPAQGMKSLSNVNVPYYEHMVAHTNGLPVHADSAAITFALNEVYRNSLAQTMRGHEEQARQKQQTRTAQNADTQGGACQEASSAAYDAMQEYLINIANENAATPTASRVQDKPISGAVWMIQQMYKQVYIPMAVLLLLPGAALTQVKGLVTAGILGGKDEDAASPITGLIRSMMAIFLIPATQLVVSYCIDTGNSLMFCVTTELQKNGRMQRVNEWMQEQAFATKPENKDNHIKPEQQTDSPNPAHGKFFNASSKTSVQERINNISASMQNCFNTVNNSIAEGLAILNAFQLVMMSYLFLLGPVAAAFFAWPAGIGKDLFKKTFSSWLDGVVVLCLWKFWWCIVLLCMAIRLETDTVDPTNQYELYYFTAFMAMLAFVPFSPFEFRPGDIVSQALEKAQQQAGKGGGGGGGGNSSGGGQKAGGNKEDQAAPASAGVADPKGSPRGGAAAATGSSSDGSQPQAQRVDGNVTPPMLSEPPTSSNGGQSSQVGSVVVADVPPPPSSQGFASEAETHGEPLYV